MTLQHFRNCSPHRNRKCSAGVVYSACSVPLALMAPACCFCGFFWFFLCGWLRWWEQVLSRSCNRSNRCEPSLTSQKKLLNHSLILPLRPEVESPEHPLHHHLPALALPPPLQSLYLWYFSIISLISLDFPQDFYSTYHGPLIFPFPFSIWAYYIPTILLENEGTSYYLPRCLKLTIQTKPILPST